MDAPMPPGKKQRLRRFFQQVRVAPSGSGPGGRPIASADRPPSAHLELATLGEPGDEGIAVEAGAASLPSPRPMDTSGVERMLRARARQQIEQEESVAESLLPASAGSGPSARRRISEGTIESALAVVTKLDAGEDLSDDEARLLEEVILPGERPVVDIIGGTFAAPAHPFAFLGDPRERRLLETAFPSIGRIELPLDRSRPFGGTGFFVGEGLLLTNRHVAALFASGLGHRASRTISYRPGGAGIDTRREVPPPGTTEPAGSGHPAPLLLTVLDVALIHPYWDVAVLVVEPRQGALLPAALTLASTRPPGPLESRHVATIGYPQRNPNSNVNLQDQEFRGLYGRKRLLPGLLGMEQDEGRIPFHRYAPRGRPEVLGLTHDCSTLTGNSGSAVIDLETGAVVGLHFAGQYLTTNWAVPTWELARDPYIRELKLNFAPVPPGAAAEADPEWLEYWRPYRAAAPVSQPVAADLPPGLGATGGPGQAPADAASRVPRLACRVGAQNAARETWHAQHPTAWYEQTDDSGIAAALRDDPVATARLLYDLLPPAEADSLIADLTVREIGEPSAESAAVEEGLFSNLFGRKADPDLPEILFLHGILGGHLARSAGLGGRLWVSPLAFLVGDLAEKLSLDPDGISEASPGQALRPDGLIRLTYAHAARTWRNAGFVVNEFAYDWRKPIELLADSLHRFIEELAFQRPGKKFALVAHSMGGVVSALYAARHREWEGRIAGTVLIGSPLHGSYAPMQAVMGTYETVRKLAFISRKDTVRDFQAMACSLSGLLDMLPDPGVFPNARPLYRVAGWPDPKLCPSELHLKRSRALKRKVSDSPLLRTAFLIVSQRHPTVANLFGTPTTRGDGTVPTRSAAAIGAASVKGRFVARESHAQLPREDAVLAAVNQLLRDGTCRLPALDMAALAADDTLPVEEAVVAERMAAPALAADPAAIRERFERGAFTEADWSWLVDGR